MEFPEKRTEVQVGYSTHGHRGRGSRPGRSDPALGAKPWCWAAPLSCPWLASAHWGHPAPSRLGQPKWQAMWLFRGSNSLIPGLPQVERGIKAAKIFSHMDKVQILATHTLTVILSLNPSEPQSLPPSNREELQALVTTQ